MFIIPKAKVKGGHPWAISSRHLFTRSSPGSLCLTHVNNSAQRFDGNIWSLGHGRAPRSGVACPLPGCRCLRRSPPPPWHCCPSLLVGCVPSPPPPSSPSNRHQTAPSAAEGTSWLSPQPPARPTLLRGGAPSCTETFVLPLWPRAVLVCCGPRPRRCGKPFVKP